MIYTDCNAITDGVGRNLGTTAGFDLTELKGQEAGEKIDVWKREAIREKRCKLDDLFPTKYSLLAARMHAEGAPLDEMVTVYCGGGVKQIVGKNKVYRCVGCKVYVRKS